jgi:hypothetical protein
MYFAANVTAGVIVRNPTLKMPAPAFLIMIGAVSHSGALVPRVYIHFAMAFAGLVEGLNIWAKHAVISPARIPPRAGKRGYRENRDLAKKWENFAFLAGFPANRLIDPIAISTNARIHPIFQFTCATLSPGDDADKQGLTSPVID